MSKMVAKSQRHELHLGCFFLLKLVVISGNNVTTVIFASLTRLHGTYHTTFTADEE